MINEWNITNEGTTENTAEAFAGEDKGVIDESKIVPIANKSNLAESGNVSAPETAANRSDGPDTQTVSNVSDTGAQAGPDYQEAPNVSAAGTQAAPNVSAAGAQTGSDYGYRRGRSAYRDAFRDDFDLNEEERPKKRFLRFRAGNGEESRDQMILSRIRDEDLMEYLALEQRRLEFLQRSREAKDKRILAAFQLLISLAAIVALTYLLQDNPTILISILYVAGIVAALHVWKHPHDGENRRRKED